MTTPSKGLDQRFLLRMTQEERDRIEFLASFLGCPMNDAIRVCLWRGTEQAAPTEVDEQVLGSGAVEAQRKRWQQFVEKVNSQRPGPIPGQMPMFSDAPSDHPPSETE